MDYYEAIKAKSLLAVLNPDDEAKLRKIMRYYSTTFNTPLHQVEQLDVDFVLTHYFESVYESLEDIELDKELADLTETFEEKVARQERESQMDANDEAILRGEDPVVLAAKEDAKKEKARLTIKAQKTPDPVLTSTSADVPKPEELPDFSVKFDDNLETEDQKLIRQMMELDSVSSPPPGKKQ